MRPFQRTENNIIEITNECIFMIMVAMIVYFDKEDEWSGSIKQAFTGLIFGNSLIITLIMIGK